MPKLEDLAQAALTGDALRLRHLTQDWLRANPHLSNCPPPDSNDPRVPIIAPANFLSFA